MRRSLPLCLPLLPRRPRPQWSAPTISPELHLPQPNEFIATDFLLLPKVAGEDEMTPPALIEDSAVSKIWYKQDSTFGQPRLSVVSKIVSPIAYTSPRAAVLTELFRLLVKDELNEFAYFATLAGVNYQLQESWCGMVLQLSGYSEKIPVLARKVAEKMRDFDPRADPARFDAVQEKLVRKYTNFSKEAPYTHVMTDLAVATRSPRWAVSERLHTLRDEAVTPAELAAFVPRLLKRFKVETLVIGNVTADGARTLVGEVVTTLAPRALLPSEIPSPRHVELPAARSFQYTGVEENEEQPCGAICVYLQCGFSSGLAAGLETRVRLSLAARIIREPAFDSLRTKQQLGYIVWTGQMNDAGVFGLQCIVQSDKFSTATLDARIEGFFSTTMPAKLDALSAEDFAEHKAAACKDLREKPKTLSEEAGRVWSEITSQRYFWNYREVYATAIEATTFDDVRAFYGEFIAPGGAGRRKLSMRVEGHKAGKPAAEGAAAEGAVAEDGGDAPAELVVACEAIAELSAFRRSMKLHICESAMTHTV